VKRRRQAPSCFDPARWYLPDDPLLGLVKIPSGSFTMDGGGNPHQVDVPDFWIARLPTTVAQFTAFLNATGFPSGSLEFLNSDVDHPVNWVSWHEAMAYCDWLELELMALAAQSIEEAIDEPIAEIWRGLLGDSLHLSLPSEAEWEKTARGTDGAAYPWGDEFDPRRCNTKEAGLGKISPVGAFPDGASPYGVLDMSGNVWCYLRTVWGPSLEEPTYRMPYDANDGREDVNADPSFLRCARGGAFTVEPERAKSTFRDAIATDSRDDADGFRIVISSQAARRESDPT